MTYLELVNKFWHKDVEFNFHANEVALYFFLLKTCNQIGWKTPFGCSNDMMMAKFGWGKGSFDTAKNRLTQADLIRFRPGNGRGNVYQYTLMGLQDETSTKENEKVYQNDTLSLKKTGVLPAKNTNPVREPYDPAKARELPSVEAPSPLVPRSPPLLPKIETEARSYIEARGLNLDPAIEAEMFLNHYTANGWKISGKIPMENRQTALNNWILNSAKFSKDGKSHTRNASEKRVNNLHSNPRPGKYKDYRL
jgi:hypothetical protein